MAKADGKDEILKSLWNTWHCQRKLYTHEDRVYGKYCTNRFRTVCHSNSKAELINKYHPVLKDWKDAHFVTLTIRSYPKKHLHFMLRKCLQGLKRIIKKYEKRQQGGAVKS